MDHSDEIFSRIDAEVKRVIGKADSDELPALGGPMLVGMSDLLDLLSALPDGAGTEALVRALTAQSIEPPAA